MGWNILSKKVCFLSQNFYYRGQHNQYSQFKSKSYQYQKYLGKLHFLSVQQNVSNQKQLKLLIKKLNEIQQELKNIFSGKLIFFIGIEIFQQMKFMQFNNVASLIEGFQELYGSLHHYTIQDKQNKLLYEKSMMGRENNNYEVTQSCHHCLNSINKINIKKLYEEVTTTQGDAFLESEKMTRENRRKMISQLDQYDILIAEKENYLRKVNQILQNKGKIGDISNQDKTYNFLSEYLSKIQKIQEKRTKSYYKTQNRQQEEKKWQQESYRHILEYIKGVLFEHFVSECSGPVKEIFKKINIDKLFKTFDDQNNADPDTTYQSKKVMQNHQVQTIQIPQFQQLRQLQKKLDFKIKQAHVLKTNKEQLQKKYVSILDLNRKIQLQMLDLKSQKKWFETQNKQIKQTYKQLKERYEKEIERYEQQQRKQIQEHVNQREKILRISKQLENEIMLLNLQISKEKNNRGKTFVEKEMQTEDNLNYFQSDEHIDEQQNDLFSKTDLFPTSQRKRSIKNKLLFSTFRNASSQRKNGFMFTGFKRTNSMLEDLPKQTINENQKNCQQLDLQIQSNVLSFTIKGQQSKQKPQKDQSNKVFKLSKPNKNTKKYGKLEQSRLDKLNMTQKTHQKSKRFNTLSSAIQFQNESNDMKLDKNKRIKISMTSFKKKRAGQEEMNVNCNFNQDKQNHNFSKFNRNNRLTQGDEPYSNQQANKLTQQFNFNNKQPLSKTKLPKPYQISQRLYKRKPKQQIQLPFQRVIQNKKQKFYIKKISRESINYKMQKQKIKEISQILKPYMYNNHNNMKLVFNNHQNFPRKENNFSNIKTIRERLSILTQNNRKKSLRKSMEEFENNGEGSRRGSRTISRQHEFQRRNSRQSEIQRRNSLTRHSSVTAFDKKNVGTHILQVQHIIEHQFAYLKAVGFIDFLLKIGIQNKKTVKAMRKIQSQVKRKFQSPTQEDLQLFGGYQQAQNYIKNKNFWSLIQIKQNMMIYNKNDGLSLKVQKYFNLLRRANPQMYGVLYNFLLNPIFAVFGNRQQPGDTNKSLMNSLLVDDGNFIRDLFNQLQKYHKLKHNQCTHVFDFLDKIGFYKYTYL